MYRFSMILVFSLSLIALWLMPGCKKDEEPIVINITSPVANAEYPNSGLLNITGTVTAEEIEDVDIEIYRVSDNAKVLDIKKEHLHKSNYTINEKFEWQPESVTTSTVFKFKIKVTDEHKKNKHGDGEGEELEFNFTIKP